MRTLALLLALSCVGVAFGQEPATDSGSTTVLGLLQGIVVYDAIDWDDLDEAVGHDVVLDALRDAGKRGWICEALGFHVWDAPGYIYAVYCPNGCDEFRHCRVCGIGQVKRATQWEDVKP